jgi:trigger factor
MQVTISELSPVEKKVAVELPWPAVAHKLDEAYKDLQRQVSLKGFRKGKVPRPILERMFGRQVEQDVVQKLVQETFIQAATEHKIEPVAEPVVDDAHLHKGKNFHYSARVEVRSVVEPQDYFGVEVRQRAAKVEDADVDKALENKRRELTEYKAIDPAQRTTSIDRDVLVFGATGTVGDDKFERDGIMADLGEPSGDPVPGIGKALVGVPLNAKDHEVAFEVAGAKEGEPARHAKLKVTVREAREKVTPALDDEFAKDTGEADTLADLRDKTKKRPSRRTSAAPRASCARRSSRRSSRRTPSRSRPPSSTGSSTSWCSAPRSR